MGHFKCLGLDELESEGGGVGVGVSLGVFVAELVNVPVDDGDCVEVAVLVAELVDDRDGVVEPV